MAPLAYEFDDIELELLTKIKEARDTKDEMGDPWLDDLTQGELEDGCRLLLEVIEAQAEADKEKPAEAG